VALTVLVVDDDAAFRALAARLLEQLGVAEIVTATDAASASIQAAARRPPAMFVEVELPDRDGVDLAEEFVTLPWSPRVMLISIDSDASNAIRDNTHEGRLSFVPKEELANGVLNSFLFGP
jgi:two-component system nitrate/nitrite response regulator NarL